MIYLATDHRGLKLKEKIKQWLSEWDYQSEDMGAFEYNPNDDYPDFIIPVAQKVASDPQSLGIVIGRSGNGEAIAANKVKAIRAVVCLNQEMAKKAKQHNNANILSLGTDYMSIDEAKQIVKVFIDTPFSNEERHVRRIEKIKKIETSR
jgi:ribose 5-phosphate isomerase B